MRTWDTLAVIGPGLIGGSIGLAALRQGVVSQVIGVGRSQTSLQTAMNRGVISNGTLDLAVGVREADLIVVCTPVDEIPYYVERVAEACKPGGADHGRRQHQGRSGRPHRAGPLGEHRLGGFGPLRRQPSPGGQRQAGLGLCPGRFVCRSGGRGHPNAAKPGRRRSCAAGLLDVAWRHDLGDVAGRA